MRPSVSRTGARPGFLFGAETKGAILWYMWGVDGQRGDSSSHKISAVVNPPTSPVVRGTGWSGAARFLISFLIPPDPIHPGPPCCNPSVGYPSMFNMLMPTTTWMNHQSKQACNHFNKDRCINTPENPLFALGRST